MEKPVVEHGLGDRHEVVQTVTKVALNDRVCAQVAPFHFEGEDFLFARRERFEVASVLRFDEGSERRHQFLRFGLWPEFCSTE